MEHLRKLGTLFGRRMFREKPKVWRIFYVSKKHLNPSMTVFVKTGDPETSGHLVSFGGEVFGDEAINPTLNTSPYHKGRQEERHHGNKSSKYNSCQTWLFRISMLNFAGCKQNFIGNGYFYIFFIGFPSGSFLSQAQNGVFWTSRLTKDGTGD